MSQPIVAVVDRIEDGVVVIETDDGARVELPRETFAFRVSEGTVLRVPVGDDGAPEWRSARRDPEEEERRRRDLRERMERLSADDAGGDVKL